MHKPVVSLLVILLVSVSVWSVTVGPALAASQMPAFSLADVVTGKTVDSRTFQGKTLLITFFATWCPPCVQEIPGLIKLQNEFSGKNFSVVGLSVDQEVTVVQNMVVAKGINYPVMMADNAVTRDFGGVYGIPTSFLVNSKGLIVKKYAGFAPHSVLVRDLKQVIE